MKKDLESNLITDIFEFDQNQEDKNEFEDLSSNQLDIKLRGHCAANVYLENLIK